MTIDHTSNSGNNLADNTTITWAHTVSPGASFLEVFTFADQNSGTLNPSNITVTFNGIVMTNANAVGFQARDGMQSWKMANPPSGTHNIVATMSFTGGIIGAAISFIGSYINFDVESSNLVTTGTSVSQTATANQIGEYVTGAYGLDSSNPTSAYAITNGTIIANLLLTCDGDVNKPGIFGYKTLPTTSPGAQTFQGTWTGSVTGYAGLLMNIIEALPYNPLYYAGD